MTNQTPILTVSQLNKQVKNFLENEIGILQVEGEVSNLSKPSSGHFYFSLKDSTAQIRCVFFKNRHRSPFAHQLKDGLKIIATGRLSLYEARGDYQLIAEDISEAGLGALYQQFEALKNKLAAEGLFDSERKKPIPFIPSTIGIITSSSGAAIQDVLSTLARRYPAARIIIYPSEVQGSTAPQQLINALQLANKQQQQCDVLLLVRGGGSIEDLWAFNNEYLARALAASIIPIISGVGHETDFTIADFVADYRAATPTAAAIAATPDQVDLINHVNALHLRLNQIINQKMSGLNLALNHLLDKISSPKTAIFTYWQSLDYLERQLAAFMSHRLKINANQLNLLEAQLQSYNPKTQIQHSQTMLTQLQEKLKQSMKYHIEGYQNRLAKNMSTLQVVSPLATLDRGYAIATQNNKILCRSKDLYPGDLIDVRLSDGLLHCEVKEIEVTSKNLA